MDATGIKIEIPVPWICLWMQKHLCREMQLCTLGSALAWGKFRAELGWATSSGLLSQPKPLDAAPEVAFPPLLSLFLGAGCGNGPAVCAV